MGRANYIAVPVMLLLVVVQTAVLPYFPILGLSPQLPFLFALAWGNVRDFEDGLIWAFIGGLLLDIFSLNPVGMTALAYLISLTAVLWIKRALPESRLLLSVLMAVLATVVYILTYSFLLSSFRGVSVTAVMPTLLPLILLHAIFMMPIYWLLYSIDHTLRPKRVTL